MAHDFTELLTRGGFDAAGLSLAPFPLAGDPERPGALAMVNEWSRAAGMPGLCDAAVPPLGIIAGDAAGPAAVMWCFESFGCGVAWLEYAMARPGLGWDAVANVLGVLVCALMASAGKSVDPPGEYHTFRACGRLANLRVLRRLGFVHAGNLHVFVLCPR